MSDKHKALNLAERDQASIDVRTFPPPSLPPVDATDPATREIRWSRIALGLLLAIAVVFLGLYLKDRNSGSPTQTTAAAPIVQQPTATYPPQVQANFMGACTATGTLSRCQCALRYLERTVGFDAFMSAEAAISRGESAPAYIMNASRAC